MPILIAILLGLSALVIVAYPLLGLDSTTTTSAAGDDALADVAERERSAKMALRDVDFDYRLGNLEENDYDALRTRYERRALAALRARYEREQALDQLIDEQLAALQDKKIGKNGNRSRRESVGTLPASSAEGENSISGKNGNRAGSSQRTFVGASGRTPSGGVNTHSGKNGNRSTPPSPTGRGAGGEVPPRPRRRKGV